MRRPAVFLTLALAAGSLTAPAHGADPMLGPGAQRLANGHYRIHLADGTTLLTHGPDYAHNHGDDIGPGDPERPPVCATDYYQHVLYGRPSGAPDRLVTVRAAITSAIRRMNALLNEESLASGDRSADYKVRCDGAGEIQIDTFTSRANDFTTIVDSARAAGFQASNADYTIFYDADGGSVCGTGSFNADERLVESNFSNFGGDYAVSYNDCWTNETPMHENGHNQGAVQYNAPHSTGTGLHCNDENDIMCYGNDGGDKNQGTVDRCTDRIYFDCRHDTYFDSAPEEGEYLATHWNIGSPLNRFIVFGEPVSGPPKAGFSLSCAALTCSFTDITTDDGSVAAWHWDFGDGERSDVQNPTHAFTEPGTYLVSLVATDDEAMTAASFQTLTLPNSGDPDPATPTLAEGTPRSDKNGADGTWRYYKIFVPAGRPHLNVSLDGPACALILCNPDLDLYVRQGRRPDTSNHACVSNDLSNDETCRIPGPAGGYWYVGVHTFFATPNVSVVQLSSVNYTVTARY